MLCVDRRSRGKLSYLTTYCKKVSIHAPRKVLTATLILSCLFIYALLYILHFLTSLITGSVHWGELQTGISRSHDQNKPHFLIGADGYASLGGQLCNTEDNPSVDYRKLGQPFVSLRDIMSEEQALQDIEKVTHTYRPTPSDALYYGCSMTDF